MKNHIAEELPARKHAPAAAGVAPTDRGDKKDDSGKSPEQKAKQAVYDIRYRARREDIPLRQAYSQYMQNSSMGQQERAIVKAKLFGKEGGTMKAEDFNPAFKDAASDSLAKALFKVFVEGTEKEQEPISLTYVEEMDTAEHRKYKVRVTDKNTKKSYVRYATREKINQLRANPNIESVEMTGYGEPYEGEKKKGSQTARVAAGKGLDPVGKEDGDVDNDGDKDKSDKYLMKRRGAIGNAIATRKEEFIHEAETEDSNTQKIDYKKGKVKNKVTVAPEQGGKGLMAHNELEGEVIVETGYEKFLKKVHSLQEKAVSQNQQQLAGMALAYLRGEMPDASEEVKNMAKMGEKKLRDFAKTKHGGLPEKVKEEMECDSDKKKKNGEGEDSRSMKTKVNLVKNKLRAMGLKMSYEPEGEQISEIPIIPIAAGAAALYGLSRIGKGMKDERTGGGKVAPAGTIKSNIQTRRAAEAELNKQLDQSYEPEGEVIDELNRVERETGINTKTGRPTQKGGDPKVKERNKPPLRFGGSRQEPKEPGKKPSSPSEEAREKGVLSPLEHKVALRRNARKAAADFRMDTRGT